MVEKDSGRALTFRVLDRSKEIKSYLFSSTYPGKTSQKLVPQLKEDPFE